VLDKKLAAAQAALADVGSGRSSTSFAIDPVPDWQRMTDDEKRAAINALIEITIEERGGYSGRYFRPERIVITDR
jgi:hypothetical protein